MAKNSKNRFNSSPMSMTGFGKASLTGDNINIDVEVRSLNNRYLDCNLKIPRIYGILEEEIRQRIAARIKRGRVEILITRQVPDEESSQIDFHPGIFEALFQIYTAQAKRYKVYDDHFKQQLLINLLGRRDVLEVAETNQLSSAETQAIMRVLDIAIERLIEMRMREGRRLSKDISARIANLTRLMKSGRKESAIFPRILKERLTARLKDISSDPSFDSRKLASEAIVFAEKWDISEELVRIDGHLDELRSSLRTPGYGKKMDFLLQELIREFNTIGAKSSTGKIASIVIDAKVEIEKIKEQVQNLE